jgi:hypothetical protein
MSPLNPNLAQANMHYNIVGHAARPRKDLSLHLQRPRDLITQTGKSPTPPGSFECYSARMATGSR